MSNVYFISDLHLGHKAVLTFENYYRATAVDVSTIEDHDDFLHAQFMKVGKRDKIFVLGDIGNVDRGMEIFNDCPAMQIKYIPGNHDHEDANRRFLTIPKLNLYSGTHKGFWVTHIPIHPTELWNRLNIHGHIHSKSLKDENYINVSVEATRGRLINFNDIKNGKYQTHNRPF